MKNIYQRDYHKKYSEDLIARKDLIDFVAEKFPFKGKVGLDAGCNGGFLTFYLAKNGAKKIYGIDMSPGFIEKDKKIAAKEKLSGKTSFRVGDISELPYKSNTFDFIVCAEVLEHVPDPEKVISEFNRVLKKNGSILLTTPNILNPAELLHNLKHMMMWLLKKEEITHIKHFTFFSLKNLFSKSFRVEKMTGVGFGAGFLPFSEFGFLKKVDKFLGNLMQPISFDIFILAKKKK